MLRSISTHVVLHSANNLINNFTKNGLPINCPKRQGFVEVNIIPTVISLKFPENVSIVKMWYVTEKTIQVVGPEQIREPRKMRNMTKLWYAKNDQETRFILEEENFYVLEPFIVNLVMNLDNIQDQYAREFNGEMYKKIFNSFACKTVCVSRPNPGVRNSIIRIVFFCVDSNFNYCAYISENFTIAKPDGSDGEEKVSGNSKENNSSQDFLSDFKGINQKPRIPDPSTSGNMNFKELFKPKIDPLVVICKWGFISLVIVVVVGVFLSLVSLLGKSRPYHRRRFRT